MVCLYHPLCILPYLTLNIKLFTSGRRKLMLIQCKKAILLSKDINFVILKPFKFGIFSFFYTFISRLHGISPVFLQLSQEFISMANQDDITRSLSDAAPTHYTVKIQSFSLLAKHAIGKYESGEFQAGGYKWKLVVYPNGNKSKNANEHMPVYLAMADRSSLPLGWEVYAIFRLFLLDQNNDNFLIVQDPMGKERRFHGLKFEWGFDQFIPLRVFNDASNGYLVEDKCVLGAEVSVINERSMGKGECLSMIKNAPSIKHLWKIENFSKLDGDCHDSKVFTAGDQKWKMQFYPKGRRHGSGIYVSMYLALADPSALSPGSKIYAAYTLRVLDQLDALHMGDKGNYRFSAPNPETGWARYIPFDEFYEPVSGCILKDVCLVEAEVTVHGISTTL